MEKLGIKFKNLDATCLINVKGDLSTETMTYKDLLKESMKVTLAIEEFAVPKESTISILDRKSFSLMALSLGIMEADFSFCYIKEEDLRIDLIDYNSRFLFSETPTDLKLLKKIKICGKEMLFYQLDIVRNLTNFNDTDDPMLNICYAIKTSGTSGTKKTVHVTYSSILPNITSLQRIFQLDHSDVILSMSPISFDPFIADLFLALHSGCALMFIDDSLRFNPIILSTTFDATGVTYMQMTPTLFQQFGIENIQQRILSANSSLKYLVLGGEAFPLPREILKWQNWESDNRKRIFNIYGVTEMSCWASIHEVTKDDMSEDKIPLGKELDETSYGYYSQPTSDYDPNDCVEQLLLLSKSRVNFINHNKSKIKNDASFNGFFACSTGDLVRRLNGKLYWHGRTNDIVKRFGERVDMNEIERIASDFNAHVSCVFVKKKIVLFYQLPPSSASEENDESFKEKFYNHLKLKLNANEIPDDIRRIAFLPMNEHGKVSKEKLRELYKEISSKDHFTNDIDVFIDAINQMFNLKLHKPSNEANGKNGDEPDGKRRRGDLDSTFNQIGGKSFDALRVAMKIDDKIGSTGLLPKLLDNQHTLKDICSFLKENKLVQVKSDVSVSTKLKLFTQFQAYNLEKCVDSSPGLLKINDTHVISVGSHSHKLININAKTLEVISRLELADRIECEVAQFKNEGIVGCYDGFLYCFDALKGKIIWKYESGGMIKSKPLAISDELVIFGNYNYNQNIRCIKVNDNNEIELKWSKMLGRLGIYANILHINKESVVVATLGSTIHRVKIDNGDEIWHKQLDSPIFSSPVIIPGRDEFIVGEVSRNIHCFDFEGNIIWNFKDFEGQLFSSFTFSSDPSKDEIKIIFGSHDKFLRCLKYCPLNQKSLKVDLDWKVELQSQIYSTPKMIKVKDKDYVISCSTNGHINFVCLKNGILEYAKKLPGEVFSSPLVYNNNSLLFIGCRDNYLYGFLL